MAIGITLAKRGRPVRFLGKKEVFDVPLAGPVLKAMGGIRVERGTGSDEPLQAAAEALEAGQLVALMPEGTIPRGPAFFDPVLKGRWGAARLAALTGAPVIPIGLWGTEKVWPRSSRTPNVLNILRPPKIRMRVGGPVAGIDGVRCRCRHQADHGGDRRAAARGGPCARGSRRAEELARTYPSGKVPAEEDLERESTRRPGTD